MKKSTGFWGLCGFSIENPALYPIAGLRRQHMALMDRVDTRLFNVRGIAYRDGKVQGIQVGFSPDSPYPDKLLSHGRIEHIGEGRGTSQTATGGNLGMLNAIGGQVQIPMLQSVGPKGKKRYAELGSYRVVSYEKRSILFESNATFTDAYVFLLEPTIFIDTRPAVDASPKPEYDGRGGFEPLHLREIAETPPQASGAAPVTTDPEVRRQALERRSNAHHALLLAFKSRANSAGLSCKCDRYADALCDGNIFEMKSLDADVVAQVRAAIGQLYHYAFLHRALAGYSSPRAIRCF